MSSVLAIIPAKPNSTRLPNKNYLEIDGEPLWERAERTAIEAKIFDQIVLSGAGRNPILCEDGVESAAVVFDVLCRDNYKHDEFCLLNPSSPCRTAEQIVWAYHYFHDHNIDCFYSVDRSGKHNGDFLFWQTIAFLRYVSRSCIPMRAFEHHALTTDGVDINTQEDFDRACYTLRNRKAV
jgi:CMP-N-acetylneuraminic acid synthetase